jgi:hypothetical protein
MHNRADKIKCNQENDHVHKREQERMSEIRTKAQESAISQLLEALGVRDPHIVHELTEVGFDTKTSRLLYLVPVIEVAWSDGNVTRREALEIERIARVNGVDEGGEAHNRLMEWLNHRPTDHFFQVCRRGVKLMLHDRSPIEARSLRRDLIEYCTRIAKVSGVFLSSVSGVSPEEERTLDDLMREFGRAIG